MMVYSANRLFVGVNVNRAFFFQGFIFYTQTGGIPGNVGLLLPVADILG
jgi:hypothetical protein